MFLPWWRRAASRQSRSSPRRGRARPPWAGRLRPAVERLEDRTLPSLFGVNLIKDPGAETGPGVTSTQDPAIPPPNPPWMTNFGNPTVAQYGSPGFLSTGTGPTDPGSNYFAGGPSATGSLDSIIVQKIDVSSAAASIDAGGVTFTLSGWLGGVTPTADFVTLSAVFQDSNKDNLGTSVVGVLIGDPDFTTPGLVFRQSKQANDVVPAGTVTIVVILELQARSGSYDDAAADDLSLVLNGGTQTQQLTQTGTPVIQNGVENGTPEQATDTTVSAQFIDQDPNATTADFTNSVNPQAGSTIDWGDGTPGNPDMTPVNLGDIQLVSSDAGSTTWQINGRHTYTEGGQYPITIHVLDKQGNKLDINAGTADVPDAALTVTSQPVSIDTDTSGNPLTENGAPFSGELLTFSDADTSATPPVPSDYKVDIEWGDGVVETLDPSQITQPGGPGSDFHVAVTHKFQKSGNLPVHVTIIDMKDQNPTDPLTHVDIPATVADPSVTRVTALSFQATAGTPATVDVGTITDADPMAEAKDYSIVISWGQGGATDTFSGAGAAAHLRSTGPGQFTIFATHQYDPSVNHFDQHYVIHVTVTDLESGVSHGEDGAAGDALVHQPGGSGSDTSQNFQGVKDGVMQKSVLQQVLKEQLDKLVKQVKGSANKNPILRRIRRLLGADNQLLGAVQALASGAAGQDPGVQALEQNFDALAAGIAAEAEQALSGGNKGKKHH